MDQIISTRTISGHLEYIKTRDQIGHREGDTVISASHHHSILAKVERMSDYAVLDKAKNITENLVGGANITQLKPLIPLVIIIAFDEDKKFSAHQKFTRHLNRPLTLQILILVESRDPINISMVSYGNIFPKINISTMTYEEYTIKRRIKRLLQKKDWN